MTYIPSLVFYTKSNIDVTTAATTTLFTTRDGGQRFFPLKIILETTSLTGFTSGGAFDIGTNSTSYNNIYENVPGPLAVVNGYEVSAISSTTPASGNDLSSIPPNTDVKLKVTLAASATEWKVKLTIIGYYA